MFILTTITDVIQIEPVDFHKPSREVLEDNINERYANKVTISAVKNKKRNFDEEDLRREGSVEFPSRRIIQKVGLCICFFDLLSASDGLIRHGKGTVNVKDGWGQTGTKRISDNGKLAAEFRLVVFRPFKGEILEGKISQSSATGINVHLEFFDDIFIPGPQNLFPNSHFDPTEKTWIWHPPTSEASPPSPPPTGTDAGPTSTTEVPPPTAETSATSTPFYFDKNERVRFRVEEEIWTDLAPTDLAPPAPSTAPSTLTHPQAHAPSTSGGEAAGGGSASGPRMTEVSDGLGRLEGKVDASLLGVGGSARPWRLVGSMAQGGLGLVSWWEGGDEDEDGQRDDGGAMEDVQVSGGNA